MLGELVMRCSFSLVLCNEKIFEGYFFFPSTLDDMLMVPFKYLWCLLETGVVYYHQGARRVKKGRYYNGNSLSKK